MKITPRRSIVLAAASLLLLVGLPAAAQGARPAKPPASPPSSVDMPTRPIAPHHRRTVKIEGGRTLLWAGVDSITGETEWFDMTDASIDPRTFQFGIGKDRIASIDEPMFVKHDDPELARLGIGPETDVLGVELNGIVRAYPVYILDRTEVVNDDFEGEPYAVCW